jgi:NADH-quinone oxidoreductase subunit C
MKPLESIEVVRERLESAVPNSCLEILNNASPSGQHSLLLNPEHALEAAIFLRDDPNYRFDYLSNVTGVDWPEIVTRAKVKVAKIIGGIQKEVEETTEKKRPGYLEAVYHLYSIAFKHGPLVIRMRTGDRAERVTLPSLTPVWRGAEFQEREIFDLFGIRFAGHPDLRRILMWDGFKDYPMRKDYREPDDYEWEPTAHGSVAEKARQHQQEAGK